MRRGWRGGGARDGGSSCVGPSWRDRTGSASSAPLAPSPCPPSPGLTAGLRLGLL